MSWMELMRWGRNCGRTARAPRRSWRERAAAQELPAQAPATDDLPLGCGWFDSSHELRAGLLVTERAPADRAAAALPLETWLGLQLRGWSLPAQAARLTSLSGLRQP